jgi:hypothetical protein
LPLIFAQVERFGQKRCTLRLRGLRFTWSILARYTRFAHSGVLTLIPTASSTRTRFAQVIHWTLVMVELSTAIHWTLVMQNLDFGDDSLDFGDANRPESGLSTGLW